MLVLRKIESTPTMGSVNKPKVPVVIEECGELWREKGEQS